jgi:hypothetical protein
MKILCLTTSGGRHYVMARDSTEELAAYLHIFKILDGLGMYEGRTPRYITACLPLARQGDKEAAKLIVRYRSRMHYEYEQVEEISVVVP